MASLRKRPDAVVEQASDESGPPDIFADPENSSPSPSAPPGAPELPADEAERALLGQIEALRQSESLQQQQQQAVAAAEERRRQWMAGNQLAQAHYQQLDALHREALQAGLVDTSEQYFHFMNDQLAAIQTQDPAEGAQKLADEMQQRIAQTAPQPPSPQSPSRFVSAPVSREPNFSGQRPSGGKVTLTPQEKEAAKLAGITEVEYGRQLLRYRQMQASGEYSDRR